MICIAGGSEKPGKFFPGVLCPFSLTHSSSLTMRDLNLGCNKDICRFLCYQRLIIDLLVLLNFYVNICKGIGVGL